jgi:tripartite-type tricarboxylate transporter receptor subunit TctC
MTWLVRIAAFAFMVAAWPFAAHAQNYPNRPIVMIVPFAAGGTFDIMGRIMAPRMSELLGQQIVVENTTGAGGIIGVQRVMNAAPDGYTLLLGSTGTHAYNQTIYKKRRYDAVTDFAPVTLWSEQPMVLEARKDLAANTIPEFAALLKANSAKMQYGSAVLSKGRSPLMPDLASAHEQGLKEFDVTTWTAFFLPKGTPKPIVDKLNEVTHATMETPLVKQRMLESGVTGVSPDRRSPEYLAKFVADEVARWEGPIKAGGLQVD